MSAQWRPAASEARRLEPMTMARLDAVMAIESAAYAVPWTRGNFVDSLASGYLAQCLLDECGTLLAYSVAMQGPGEMHLLNLTVAPQHQGRGYARHMLDALVAACRLGGSTHLWLEVREGNARARSLYRRYGMVEAGRRRAYYPATLDGRMPKSEDAVVMSLSLQEAPP